MILAAVDSAAFASPRRFPNLDAELNRRAVSGRSARLSSVIVRVKGVDLPVELRKYARPGKLNLVNGYVLDVPDAELKVVAAHPSIAFASVNGVVQAFNFRTGVQSGAFFVRQMMGLTGAGVGVAVLDSGIAPVDDFGKRPNFGRMPGQSRIAFFRDFLVPNPALSVGDPLCPAPCDPNGHGTHVAGTIAGNGFDSFGQNSGIAPEASLFALRVLGRDGSGSLAGVLHALEWVSANAKARNIRVVNLSFGMVPAGSLPADGSIPALLAEDPLAVATKALADAGIFVVGAAGNFGQIACAGLPGNPAPDPDTGKCDVWGGITAPGTYPWVFTAGASSSNGTFERGDDAHAAFSSRGPAFPLQNAKPDLLAGAVGIESASAPGSTLYESASRLGFLVPGAFPMATMPYMALSGTSQATAVISGVAALMLEANPKLTPNLMKAILQYTAEDRGTNALEEGAGFVNALGAVRLSRFYATARRGQRVPVQPIWSKHFIWGNHEMSGGIMLPGANAWQLGVVWGTPRVNGNSGDNVVWGTSCGSGDCGDNVVWGTSSGDNIVWGTADGDNVVWGTSVAGDNVVWGTSAHGDNVVWGTDCGGQDCGGNVVWGTAASGDNVVWGTANAGDNVVWGTSASGDNVVWGTNSNGDNIVWGTAFGGDNVVWGTAADGDNVVWGTSAAVAGGVLWDTSSDDDTVTWGTWDGDNVVWGTDSDSVIWRPGPAATPVTSTDWYRLFLHRRFSMWWVAREFGDRFVSKGGHALPPPTKSMRRRAR